MSLFWWLGFKLDTPLKTYCCEMGIRVNYLNKSSLKILSQPLSVVQSTSQGSCCRNENGKLNTFYTENDLVTPAQGLDFNSFFSTSVPA